MAIQAGDILYTFRGDLSKLNAAMAESQKVVAKHTGNLLEGGRQIGIALAAAGAAVAGGLGIAVKASMDFDQAIANAASVTGKTGAEFDAAKQKMYDMALVLGERTVFSASEAANAFYNLSSKGFDVAAMSLDELEPILGLAAATQYDLAQTTDIATSALRGFGFENSEMGRVADVMAKAIGSSAANMEKFSYSIPYVSTAANVLGIEFEQVIAILGELYNKGIDASSAGSALRNVMLKIQEGGKPLTDVFDEVNARLVAQAGGAENAGVSFEKFKEIMRGPGGLTAAFEYLNEQGVTAEEVMEMFQLRNGTAAAVILQNTDNINALAEELRSAGGAAQDMATKQLDTLGGKMEELSGAMDTLVIRIGKALTPAVEAVALALTDVIRSISNFVANNPGLTTAITVAAAAFAAMAIPVGALLIFLPSLVMLVGMIGAALSAITPVIALVIAGCAALATVIAGVVVVAIQYFRNVYEENKDQIERISRQMADAVSTAFQIIARVAQIAWTIVQAVIEGIARAFGYDLGDALTSFEGFMTALNTGLDAMLGAVTGWAMGLQYSIGFVADYIAQVAGWIGNVLGFISGAVQGMGRAMNFINPLSGDFGSLPALYGKAAGGPASGLTLVGERGPEIVALPRGAQVYGSLDTERMLRGGGGGVTLNFGAPLVHVEHMNADDPASVEMMSRRLYEHISSRMAARGVPAYGV